MKNLKQNFEVILRLTLALIITITSFGYSTVVLENSKEKGYIIKIGLNKRLDYLKIIDEYGGNYGKDGR